VPDWHTRPTSPLMMCAPVARALARRAVTTSFPFGVRRCERRNRPCPFRSRPMGCDQTGASMPCSPGSPLRSPTPARRPRPICCSILHVHATSPNRPTSLPVTLRPLLLGTSTSFRPTRRTSSRCRQARPTRPGLLRAMTTSVTSCSASTLYRSLSPTSDAKRAPWGVEDGTRMARFSAPIQPLCIPAPVFSPMQLPVRPWSSLGMMTTLTTITRLFQGMPRPPRAATSLPISSTIFTTAASLLPSMATSTPRMRSGVPLRTAGGSGHFPP
jgi:hypothetical protein